MYHQTMKFKRTLLILTFGLAAASAADVASVSNVYILPMAGGMDQYLALRMTTGNVMQVVTDPLKADVVMTDHIGGGFDEKWKELYPPEKPPAPKDDQGKDKKADKGDKKDDKDDKSDLFTVQRGASQPISRGRGAYFLIDRQTRNVLWSTYARPKSNDPDDVNHTADQIVKDLAKARKPKAEK
jgi:hypothetical protein